MCLSDVNGSFVLLQRNTFFYPIGFFPSLEMNKKCKNMCGNILFVGSASEWEQRMCSGPFRSLPSPLGSVWGGFHSWLCIRVRVSLNIVITWHSENIHQKPASYFRPIWNNSFGMKRWSAFHFRPPHLGCTTEVLHNVGGSMGCWRWQGVGDAKSLRLPWSLGHPGNFLNPVLLQV